MSKAPTPSLPLYNAAGLPSKSSRPSSPMLQPPEALKRSTTPSSITSAHSLLSAQDTAHKLSTSLTHGLSASDASARIHIHGTNELPHEEPEPLWLRFLKQFKETLILLLLGSAGVSLVLGNLEDAVSIAVAVTIVVTVGFVQEYRSEKSIEALNQLVPHSAHIIRAGVEPSRGRRVPNGTANESIELDNLKDTTASLAAAERKSTTISATLLVPGDLVLFHTGDRIPADIRITHAADLSIDESNLTGENEPVAKSPDTITPPPAVQRPSSPFYASEAAGTVGADIRLNDQKNIAFMGTLVRSGYGQGIVVGTGGNTEFGAISASLQQIESPRTPLQLSMDRLGKDLSYMSFGVIAFIGLVGLWRGWKFLQVFQIAVSLAVAAIPEGLPIIVTVTLALGVLRMSKRDAIVRRLPSVETLASVNVVCTDKTGTLTTNHMTVTKIWHFDEASPVDVKKKHDSTDLDSPTRNILRIGNIVNNARLLSDQAASASTAAVLSSTLGGDDNTAAKSRWVGQPTDVALLDLMDAFGEDDIREMLGDRKFETPFSSERKWMGVVVGGSSGNLTPGSDYAYIKGALERVLDRCDMYVTAQGKEVALDQARKQEAMKAADQMAQEGLRVLGFASGASRGKKRNASGTASPAPSTNSALGDDEQYRGLVFAGLVGMNDPPRKGVERAIRRLIAGKVKVIMITGDAETTAVAIGKSLGMPIMPNSALGRSVIRGDELDQMSEEELAQAIATTSIFARTSPEHKMKIVRALQSRGDVVAMTGDGVNDAPALKKADIGISMGRLGTDVAKEAADMILTDDNFATILNAIEEGKGIFYNIQNFLTFQLSTSAAALSLVLLSTFLGFENPLNAMQILWINILMDGPPAQSLGVEPVDPAVMALPPRPRQARVLTRPLIQRVLQSATIIMLGTLTTYYLEMSSDNIVTARDTTAPKYIHTSLRSVVNMPPSALEPVITPEPPKDTTKQTTPPPSNPAHEEQQYLSLIRDILENGEHRPDRTGTGTRAIPFPAQMKFALSRPSSNPTEPPELILPLLTTKRVFTRAVIGELLWFVAGSTHSKSLSDAGIKIWDGNGSREYLDKVGLNHYEEGELGPVYGFQWRHFGAEYKGHAEDYTGQGVDQLAEIIDKLKNKPYDRRIILSAWNPADIKKMALPPCHMFAQFYVSFPGHKQGEERPRGVLHSLLYQRSCDMGLGVPFNIASYALLTHMLAHVCDLTPGTFTHTMGDAHVYIDHIDALKVQLEREPREFPTLKINREIGGSIDGWKAEEFEVLGYKPHAAISMKMSV